MRYGNCWTYALPRWLRNPRGSYLVVRMSKHAFWPHVFLAHSIDGLEVEEFKPVKPKEGVRAWFHAIIYEGRVRKGKGEE